MGQSETSWMEPLLLIHDPRNEYRIGQFMTVDGRPAVLRSATDTGTVLHGEVEVYESREARDIAVAKESSERQREARRRAKTAPRRHYD